MQIKKDDIQKKILSIVNISDHPGNFKLKCGFVRSSGSPAMKTAQEQLM